MQYVYGSPVTCRAFWSIILLRFSVNCKSVSANWTGEPWQWSDRSMLILRHNFLLNYIVEYDLAFVTTNSVSTIFTSIIQSTSWFIVGGLNFPQLSFEVTDICSMYCYQHLRRWSLKGRPTSTNYNDSASVRWTLNYSFMMVSFIYPTCLSWIVIRVTFAYSNTSRHNSLMELLWFCCTNWNELFTLPVEHTMSKYARVSSMLVICTESRHLFACVYTWYFDELVQLGV